MVVTTFNFSSSPLPGSTLLCLIEPGLDLNQARFALQHGFLVKCCGSGGEHISRYNHLRDHLHDTAVAAGLGPAREVRLLIPGEDSRPADVRLPHWVGGKDAALDITQLNCGQLSPSGHCGRGSHRGRACLNTCLQTEDEGHRRGMPQASRCLHAPGGGVPGEGG